MGQKETDEAPVKGKSLRRKVMRHFASWAALVLLLLLVWSMARPALRQESASSPGGLEPTTVTRPSVPPTTGKPPAPTPTTIPAGARVAEVLINNLNLRSAPKVNKNVVGRLRRGETVFVVGRTDGWLEVMRRDGTKGFVTANSKFIRER